MIKAIVKKAGVVTHQAFFATEQLANSWIAAQENTSSFGKKARLVAEDQLLVEGEDVAQSTEMFIENVLGQEIKFYRFNAEYTKELVDVTGEYAAQLKLDNRQKKRAFGLGLIDTIASINEGKSLTPEQVDAFMSNTLIASLTAHLTAGNIDTFINKLQASDVSAFFSSQEKAAVVAKCEAFLQTLGG